MRSEDSRVGRKDSSPELCFPRKCLLASGVRADAASLPHLSSPLPVPLRVSVPGWCFLVAAAAVSMCVTDPERSATGDPLPPPLRLARGAAELTCAPLWPSPPASRSFVGRRCAANGLSAARCSTRLSDRAGLSRLPDPRPGLGKGRAAMALTGTSSLFALFPPAASVVPLSWGSGSLRKRAGLALKGASAPGPL